MHILMTPLFVNRSMVLCHFRVYRTKCHHTLSNVRSFNSFKKQRETSHFEAQKIIILLHKVQSKFNFAFSLHVKGIIILIYATSSRSPFLELLPYIPLNALISNAFTLSFQPVLKLIQAIYL